MPIILSKVEAQALRDLIEAGETLWTSARTIKTTQQRSIVRTDVALVGFKRALDAVRTIQEDKLNVTAR